MVPEWGARSHGGAGHGRHHHRVAGVITGAYAGTQQAIQLGLLPRVETLAPPRAMLVRPICTWIGDARGRDPARRLLQDFRARWRLTYGIAVTARGMHSDHRRGRHVEGLALAPAGCACTHAAADCARCGVPWRRDALKIKQGGWIPLALGVGSFLLMWTLRRRLAATRRKVASASHGPRRQT